MGVLIVFAPVLVDGKTLSTASYTLGTNGTGPFEGQVTVGGDPYRLDVSASALAFEPWAEVSSRDLADGDVPLWNPYQASGTPHAANMQSSVFDPLNVVVNIHPTPRTWDLTLIATFALGAIFTYVLARVLGMGYLAAVVGGTAFSLSGYFSLYSNNGFVRTYMYLPLLCLLVEWVLRSKRFMAIPLLGLAVFGTIAVGMPEIAIFVVALGGSYAVYRLFRGPRTRSRPEGLAALAAAFLFGVALASPLLAVFVQYESLSFNIHKAESGVGLKTDPPQRILTWFAPFFNGHPANSTSNPGSISGVRNWIGGAVWGLVLVGLASRTRAARLAVPFFAVVSIFLVAKTYGLPLVADVGRLPVVERVSFPDFGLPTVGFAVALIAACGVDGIRRHEFRRSWLLAGIGASIVAWAWLLGINRAVLELVPTRQLFAELGLAVVMFVGVVVLALLASRRAAAYVVGGLVLVELVLLAPNPFAERRDPYVAPAWVEALQRELAERPTDRIFALDTLLYPNTAAGYGLYDVRMLDALYSDRYYRYLKEFVVPGMFDRFAGSTIGSSEGETEYRDNQMFDLLGVRYLVTTQDEAVGFLTGLIPPGTMTDMLGVGTVTVGGEPRTAIFEHAPGDLPLVLPTPIAGTLAFSYGVDDIALSGGEADGVQFGVVAERRSGARDVLWTGLYAPGDPGDSEPAGWRTAGVEIPASEDPVVQLRLVTEPRGSSTADWAGWTDIDVRDSGGTPLRAPGSFLEVDDVDGVHILENQGAIPRSFVVHDVTVVPDIDAAVAAFADGSSRFASGAVRVDAFDVTERAVVESEPDAIPSTLTDGGAACAGPTAESEIVDYQSDEVRIEVDTACDGLLVLSDSYFPGWEATVNGEAVEIHATDVGFRGVVVEAGRSEVVFRYRPGNFRAATVLALAATVSMVAAGVVSVVRRRRRTGDEVAAP